MFPTRFGLPRPIKHYRKGRVIPPNPVENVPNLITEKGQIDENGLINYNMNRYVKSSNGTSLGGGFGGSGLLNEMQDKPGAFIIKENTNTSGTYELGELCGKCESIGITSNYQPNSFYLSENPNPETSSKDFCFNQEKFARKRVVYASTNLKKNYFTTTKQYLQNRCKTYDQKSFNFLSYNTNNSLQNNNNPYFTTINGATAGSPNTVNNTYLAKCQPNGQIYQGTINGFIYEFLNLLVADGIITTTQMNEFYQTGINTIQGFFNWLLILPEPQRDQATTLFKNTIKNPNSPLYSLFSSNLLGCQLTVYKPNNYQYAKEGAVSSSTRLLKLNVNTISTNAASINNNNNLGNQLVTAANQIYTGDANNYTNLLKLKTPECNTPRPLNFSQSGTYQNKRYCQTSQV